MTEEDNKKLWKLRPTINPYKHSNVASSIRLSDKCEHADPQENPVSCDNCLLYCRKCNELVSWKDHCEKYNCPVSNKFPGSDADIAEEIRVWMKEQCSETQYKYFEIIHKAWLDVAIKDFSDEAFSEWLLHQVTPADKIQSFLKLEVT